MEPVQQSQPNIQKLTLLSNLSNEIPHRDPRPIIPKLVEIKQQAAAKFPNLGLEAYDIVRANDYMYAAQHKTTKELIVTFNGQNIQLIGIASCLVSALRFTRDIIKEYKNSKITLTGFGPGAALAERVAYFTGKPCESFNPTPMSANFDQLFHSLSNVTERTIQPNSIPRITNVQTKPVVRTEENKTNNNVTGSMPLDNLNYNELARIKGIYMDEKTNACSFILRPAAEANSLDISVSDLLTALAIFYDPNVNAKHISFSLEPADEKNPQCPQQMKIYWPDKSDGKTILQGTELGEVFFRADYHMKQMSMGTQPVMEAGKAVSKEFVYPERLLKLGLQPSFKYGGYTKGKLDWSRLWLVVKELKVNRVSGDKKVKYFDVSDVVMGVEARQMTVNQAGKLEDMQIQDANHGSCKFANKFTELYEEIAKEYPVYQRLKQAAKAVALAQWMWVNRVPIDFQRIKGMIKKAVNYTNLVPALEYQFEADEGHTVRVFGGVDMGISFNQLIEPDTKSLMKFEEAKSVQVTSSVLQQPPQFQDAIPNPFVQKANCATCSCKLHLAELLHPHNGNYYCTTHHPLYCWGCYDFIQEKYMKLGNSAAFHADCFQCAKCAHPLSGELGMIAETAYMHKDCSSTASKELMAARVKDQPSGQSPSNNGAQLTIFQRKLDRVMSLNGNGDTMAYSLIPPSAGSEEGYKLGKTGLDASGEQILPIIQNILEKTGMNGVDAVIAKLKGKKELTQQEIAGVNEKLSSFGGKRVLDDLYNRVLAGTDKHIHTVIESITDAGMKEKVKKSEHAKLLLVDYDSQWKLDTRLVAFLSGMNVPVDEKTLVIIDKDADVAAEINRLVDKTKVTQVNKVEVMRRRNNVEKVAKEEIA